MGKHLLLEVYNVDFHLINDVESLQNIMIKGIKRANMTILNIFSHCFIPQGCTVVIALAESHVSCHTWPEEGCIAVDVYTCGDSDPKLGCDMIISQLHSTNHTLSYIER
jgi:S-adenosylmethionine decarboxylase